MTCDCSHHSSAMFPAGYWPDDWTLVPGRSQKLLRCHNAQTASGIHSGSLFPGINLPKREANHSSLCGAEAKNAHSVRASCFTSKKQLTPQSRVLVEKVMRSLVDEEISGVLWKPKVYSRVSSSPPPVSVLSQMNQSTPSKPISRKYVLILSSHYVQVYRAVSSLQASNQHCLRISDFPCALHNR